MFTFSNPILPEPSYAGRRRIVPEQCAGKPGALERGELSHGQARGACHANPERAR